MSIYFAQAQIGGPIKIGCSEGPPKRLRELQLTCPFRLRLLGFIDGDSEEEKRIHKKFKKWRSHGEWFHVNQELIDFLPDGITSRISEVRSVYAEVDRNLKKQLTEKVSYINSLHRIKGLIKQNKRLKRKVSQGYQKLLDRA